MSNRATLTTLERARVLLAATRTGELSLLLPQLGFDDAELAHGHELYNSCNRLRLVVDTAYGAKEDCTGAVVEQTKKVRALYNRLARMARGIFANDREALKTLGLVNRRRTAAPTMVDDAAADEAQAASKRTATGSKSQAVFLGNAQQIYEGALTHPRILAELTKYGYAEARLRAEMLELGTLQAFDVEQERLKALSKGHTADLKASVTALAKWMKRFTSIIVPALEDRPELLSSMGLKPRSRRVPA